MCHASEKIMRCDLHVSKGNEREKTLRKSHNPYASVVNVNAHFLVQQLNDLRRHTVRAAADLDTAS